jgi:hypothetical protein
MFTKGQSGNPAGKPKGARGKATLIAEQLMDGETEALTRKCIALALAGDLQAMRLCLERILPPRKDRPVLFQLPPMKTLADAVQAVGLITDAVAAGDLTPGEAADFVKLVDSFTKATEILDLAARIEALEQGRQSGAAA